MTYQTVDRPGVVTAASILLLVSGGLGILVSLFLLLDGVAGSGPGLLAILVLLGASVLTIVLATKILDGSNVARIVTIVLMGIGVAVDLADFTGLEVISIGLSLLVIGLLSGSRNARAYFNRLDPDSDRPPEREGLRRDSSAARRSAEPPSESP